MMHARHEARCFNSGMWLVLMLSSRTARSADTDGGNYVQAKFGIV